MSSGKYPNVLFFRDEKYADIDAFFSQYQEKHGKIDCTLHFTSNYDDCMKLFSPEFPILVTYAKGENESQYAWHINQRLTDRMFKRWIHFSEITEANIREFVRGINFCYVDNCIAEKRNRPVFSMFTTCFNTFEKIHRVYESLKTQTFRDWEWVILDDSTDEKNFPYLRNVFKGDPRIRLYKRECNSGIIGNVKNEAVALCRGEYVLELDHDDELMPTTLEWAVKVFREHADVGFVWMDFINIYEDGSNFWFGDWISRGYGAYYSQKFRGRWAYVYLCPNMNNITAGFLTSLPNHPRIWRKSVLDEIGNYCEFLPICDDQEVLMKTMRATKTAKVPIMAYVQYMNQGSGNFTWIRNAEINRIGPNFIHPQFYEKYEMQKMYEAKGAHEDEKYMFQDFTKIWKRGPDYKHIYDNLVIPPYKRQYMLMNVDQLENPEFLRAWTSRTADDDFMVISNDLPYTELWAHLDRYGFGVEGMRCASMTDCTRDECVKFFDELYKSCETFTLFENPVRSKWVDSKVVDRTKVSRANVVNAFLTRETSSTDDKEDAEDEKGIDYLEIGVETGMTFQAIEAAHKVGVDPDPVDKDPRIIHKTSDDFFAGNEETFDAVFIDGMHQSDYVVRDLANTLRVLKTGKTTYIFIDDVMPRDQREQYRIPVHNYTENGILKYRCPWTGDVWVALYDLLLKHGDKLRVHIHTHSSYRGVACLEVDEPFVYEAPDLETLLETYTYEKDFNEYQTLLMELCGRR